MAEQQFEQVFEKHQAEVQRVIARYTNNPDDVQDLTQEVFVRAYRAFSRFSEGTNIGAWLYRIAINVCANAAKARIRHRKYVTQGPQDWDIPSELCDVVDELARKQERGHLKQAMRSLSADQLLVITLRFSDQLTLPEISEVLGVPVDTVKSRLRAVLARIQSAYNYANLDISRRCQSPFMEVVQGQDLDQFLVDGEMGGRIYHSLGSLYLRKGLIVAALQEWTRAQKAAPTFLDAYVDSAEQYVAISQPAKAVDTLETAVSKIHSADLHVRLAGLYLDNMRDVDEGIQHSKYAIEIEPKNPQAHYTAGRVYYEQAARQENVAMTQGNRHKVIDVIMASWRQSASHLEAAIRLNEVFPKASSLLACAYIQEEKVEQAVRESLTAFNHADGDDSIVYSTGWVHLRAHKLEAAESFLKQSIADRMTPRKMWSLANVLRSMNRWEEAYDVFLQALTLPGDKALMAAVSANTASAALHLGKLDEAIEHAETAMRLDPNQVHAYCNLADAHLRRGDSPQIAVNLCLQGRRVHSIHLCFHRLLAEAYYRLQKYDGALCEATTAVESEPEEPQRWVLRAKILIKLGQFEEAREDAQTALDLDPGNDDVKAIMAEIDETTAQLLAKQGNTLPPRCV